LPPIEALQVWLLVFIDYIAAKKIIAPALNAMAGGPSRVFQQSSHVLEEASNATMTVASAQARMISFENRIVRPSFSMRMLKQRTALMD
jgi:hypothetical protein